MLPGFGRHDPNPWGLGVEVRGAKHPHWTGRTNHATPFGHFGRSGDFPWEQTNRVAELKSALGLS